MFDMAFQTCRPVRRSRRRPGAATEMKGESRCEKEERAPPFQQDPAEKPDIELGEKPIQYDRGGKPGDFVLPDRNPPAADDRLHLHSGQK